MTGSLLSQPGWNSSADLCFPTAAQCLLRAKPVPEGEWVCGQLPFTRGLPDPGQFSVPEAVRPLVPSFAKNEVPSQVQRDPEAGRRLGASQHRGRKRA